jgi:hypothetical protein
MPLDGFYDDQRLVVEVSGHAPRPPVDSARPMPSAAHDS